jgi:alpha-1,3/alpha-1,6-mannosyltransferase
VQEWTEVMRIALEDGDGEQRLREMGQWGKDRVVAEFSKDKMGERLETTIQAMLQQEGRQPLVSFFAIMFAVGLHGAFAAVVLWLVARQSS